MQSTDIPAKFPIPFGNNAAGGTIRSIPQASQIGVQAGAASLHDGFPPVTQIPVGAGGTPPFGQDMNGILFQSTGWDRWFSAGGPVAYDATFQTAIGGYPAGARVMATNGSIWRSTTENNMTDPNAGGAGWVGPPTYTRLAAGSGTYSTPAGCTRIRVRMCAGGGSAGNLSVNGNAGSNTSFGSWTTIGGGAGGSGNVGSGSLLNGGIGGTGGTNGSGILIARIAGGPGQNGWSGSNSSSGFFASSAPAGMNPFGGGPGTSPAPNTGAGSSTYTSFNTNNSGGAQAGAGGAGEYVEFEIRSPSATYAYVVGAGGSAVAGGFAASSGVIQVQELYD